MRVTCVGFLIVLSCVVLTGSTAIDDDFAIDGIINNEYEDKIDDVDVTMGGMFVKEHQKYADDVIVKAYVAEETCSDTISKRECSRNTAKRLCEKRHNFMKTYCQRTCGYCGCFDVYTRCKKFKASCMKGQPYHNYIKHTCRETCKLCVNGKWGDWESWSACSATCGRGHHTRERLCNNPSPSDDGVRCLTKDKRRDTAEIESGTCDAGGCPVKGNWGKWSVWSSCSASCGDGHVTRARQCNNPSPSNGGSRCEVTDKSGRESEETETKHCHEGACPVNGNWGDWSTWSPCSASCGIGHMTRRRLCNNPTPSHGGARCEIVAKGQRDSSETRRRSCNAGACPSNCKDKQNTKNCERWKKQKKCNNPGIKARCQMTCELCDKNVTPKPTPPVTYPPIEQPHCGNDTLNDETRDTESLTTDMDMDKQPAAIVKKIVGGDNARRHVWVWQGILQHKGQFHCGGTLLTPSLFLTAAHCVHNLKKENFEVRMGYHKKDGSDKSGQISDIERIIVHEYYRDDSMNNNMFYNDIALIKVNRPFTFNKKVGTACLPKDNATLPTTEECYITGWGKTEPNGLLHATILQQARMSLKPYKNCTSYRSMTDNQFCGAGYSDDSVTACQGDSGGPLVCKSDDDNKWFIQGVVSFGTAECRAAQGLTVFSRVSKYGKWLRKSANEM